MKSQRNKTIDFPLSEADVYLKNCLKEGDDFQINKTLLGDFYYWVEKVPDNSIDLLIVDPPYNLDKNFHGKTFKALNNSSYEEYTEKWLEVLLPKLKKTASVYVCCDWKSALAIGPIMQEKLKLRNRITWQREKGRGAKTNWKNSMEDVFFATVSNEYTFNLDAVKVRKRVLAPYKENGKPKDWEQTEQGNFRNTCPSNFWDDIAIPYWSMPENTAHPTQKPEKLIAKLILASSNIGDVVLDPFAGSGTTGVVAKKLGRNFINIEQNPLYCAWAEKRLTDCAKGDRIQGYEDGIFWERNANQYIAKKKK